MAEDASGKPPPLMGATAIRPPERFGMEKYTYFLYDPKSGEVLTRTPKSWALIILFYAVYYSCLAGFWLACMKIFLTIQIQDPTDETILNAKPTWTAADSIIGVNPGIGVRPSQPDLTINSGIFTLDLDFDGKHLTIDPEAPEKIKDITGSKGYAYRAHQFFKVYRDNKANPSDSKVCVKADLDEEGYRKDAEIFCRFETDTLKVGDRGCDAFPYGYGKSNFMPCVFLKLNRIMELKPKPIKDKDTVDESLRNNPSSWAFVNKLADAGYPNEVFIKCEGDYPADTEALAGNMVVYPENPKVTGLNAAAIPLKYFPYLKYRKDAEGKGHNENAIVAIQFRNLEQHKGRLIHVICRAFYEGVVHSKKNKAGLVKFELYLPKKDE